MAGGSFVQKRTRIKGLVVFGGLIAGMSIFASTDAVSQEPAIRHQVVRDVEIQDVQPQSFLMNLPKCAKARNTKEDDPPRMGTLGSGLNCTGTWRVECTSEV